MKIADFEIDAIYDQKTGIYYMKYEKGRRPTFQINPQDKFATVLQNKPLKKLLSFIDYLISKSVHPKQLSPGVLTALARQYFHCSEPVARNYSDTVWFLCKMSIFF